MKIRKSKNILLFALAFVLLAIGIVPELEAENLEVKEHIAIAPRSIPVPPSGNASFGVTRLNYRKGSQGDSDTSISRIEFQVTKTGSLSYTDIASVKVYYEPNGGAGTYDNGDPAGDDLDIMTGSSYDTGTGAGWVTLDPTLNSVAWGGGAFLFVVLELKNTADTASSVGCEITSVIHGPVGVGIGGSASPTAPGPHNTQDDLDTYQVNLTATGITTGDKDQASTNVPVLELELTTVDSSAADIDLDSIKLHSLGTDDADIALAGVLLYEDVDGDDVFEPGGDDGVALASGSLTGGYVTLNPPVDLIFTPTVTRRFFVAVNVALTATVGNTIELEVENPSTDFTFKDIVYDDNQGVLADYSYVPLGYPYVQEGYLTGTSATPTTGNSFNVTELYVPTPPTVSSIVPGDGATGILRSTNVTAEFSEAMDSTTIDSPATNFILFIDNNSNSTYDAGTDTDVPGTVSYDGPSMTATFDPTSDLDWSTAYTAMVTTGVQDSNDGLNMTLDRVWVFSTQVAVYPMVTATSPAAYDTGVLLGAVITADFSKDMDDTTIDTTTFILFIDNNSNSTYDVGTDTPITGTVSYNAGARQATFDPSSLDPGTVYTATITTGAQATDGLNLQADKVWTFFTSLRPVVLSKVPGVGAQGISRSTMVTATFSKDIELSTIESPATNFILFIDNNSNSTYDAGTDTLIPGDVSYDSGSYTATFDPTSYLDWGTTYTVTITTLVEDTDGINPQSDTVWTFDTVAAIYPEVASTSPAPDVTEVLPDALVVATFSKDMDAATIESPATNFLLFIDNNSNSTYDAGTDTLINGSVGYNAGTREATFDPSTSLAPGTEYTATIETGAQDTVGLNLQSDKVWSFWTTLRPSVTAVTPALGVTGVLPGAVITADFSKDMVQATVEGAFSLKDGANNPVTGVAVYDGPSRVLTFTPSSSLAPGNVFTATITTAAQDTVGFNLQSDKIWSFSTAFRPFVATVTPLDGTTGVNRATTIRATFSKDIDPTTIESPATTFILFIDNDSNNSYDAGTDTLIPGNVSYDSGSYTATFTPDSNLGYFAYTATITTGVEDPDGIAMGAAKTWDFSTLPTLNEPLITSNRIVSGGNQQALIFVTEPPGGPSDRVSVQVFTTSGRRVATLVNNLPFSSISVPIVWDGTNGRGEKLGPGLYFVQIRAAGYKRVLKVMIVR